VSVRGFRLALDFTGNGDFTGPYDDVTSYILRADPVAVSWGRDPASGWPAITAGKLTFTLNNQSRLFSPENSASPVAAALLPGLGARWTDTDPDGTVRCRMEGVLDDFDADPTAPARTFTATVLDGWGWPGSPALSTPVYSGLRTGDAIGLVLDAMGWPADRRDLDPGATYIPFWWEEGTDGAEAITKLVRSEGPPALVYVAGGMFTLRDRHHRVLRDTSLISQGTYTHIIPSGPLTGPDVKMLTGTISYDHGLRGISNAADFEVQARAPQPHGVVWSSDETYSLAASQVLPIAFTASDPFTGALTPAAGTDYTVMSGTVSVTLSRDSGQSATVFLTATGGAPAVVQGMAVQAASLPVTGTVKISSSDDASVAARGRQQWQGDVPWCDPYDAQAIADRVVALYGQARPRITFTVSASVSPNWGRQALARQVSDAVTVRDDQIGMSRLMIIEQIAHEIRNLSRVDVTFTCEPPEPAQPATAITFDVAGHGFNDGSFGTGGIVSAANVFRFGTAGHGFDQGLLAY
jgi:hypothetical protein